MWGVWAPGASVPCRGERERRLLRDRASSLESGQSVGVGGSWGASRGAAWYWGGGGSPVIHGSATQGCGGGSGWWYGSSDCPWRGLARGAPSAWTWWPGGYGSWYRGGWLVRGGWPLLVGGVCGWTAQWLPSHSLVLFVHGGLWPGGVGWWAVVVVGLVLVVVVVGPLVVVVLVVVG